MSQARDPAIFVMLVMTVAMATAIGVVVYLVLQPPEVPLVPDAGGPRRKPCDARDPARMICEPGYYCDYDRCERVPEVRRAGEGESCADQDCEDGLTCHMRRCKRPEDVVPMPLVCEQNPALLEAVRTLAAECAARKSAGELVSLGACRPEDWEALVLDDKRFDLLLAAFPNRFAVHFPSGLPSEGDEDWPTQQALDSYLEQIRPFAPALRSARQLFFIGRASPDGNPRSNHFLALQRIKLVENLVTRIRREGLPRTAPDDVKIRSFGLPKERALRPDRYRQSYLLDPGGNTPALDPLVTADRRSHDWLRDALNGGIDLKDTTTPEWQELYGAINRVVFVIPIPCLGDEVPLAPADDLTIPDPKASP